MGVVYSAASPIIHVNRFDMPEMICVLRLQRDIVTGCMNNTKVISVNEGEIFLGKHINLSFSDGKYAGFRLERII